MPAGIYLHAVQPLAERLEEWSEPEPNSGCWLWIGRRAPNGYGMLSVGRRSLGEKKTCYAHRVSYETHRGPVPSGLDLDHRCRLRPCINPWHTEPATRSVNTRRGIGPAMLGALNSTKTHCKNGHLFDEANTRHRPAGGRACRACERRAD